MQVGWGILNATFYCHYKAWLIATNEENSRQEGNSLSLKQPLDTEKQVMLPISKLNLPDALASFAELLNNGEDIKVPTRYKKRAQKLLEETKAILSNDAPPAFYKNPHCPECQFRESCYKKLKERDDISLLGGVSPKVLAKFHKKGIFSITQLSHIFRPRRRSGKSYATGTFLWELKALAIREQKTFVVQPPNLSESPTSCKRRLS